MSPLRQPGTMPPARLHDQFIRQAMQTPDATALLYEGRSYSYRHLDRRTNQVARCLQARGAAPGTRVGLCLERSPDLIVSLIGILKAGCAYVPIDPLYPPDRLSLILSDSDASFLITRQDLAASIRYDGTIFDMSAQAGAIDKMPDDAISNDIDGNDLACLFYTSGSTGKPKGVMLAHTATRMVAWAADAFPNGELKRVAATTSVCFDPSIFEIFAPLSTGNTILLKSDLLAPFAPDECPTMLNGVPSAFNELVRTNRIPASVQVINIGGERLRADLARDIYRQTQVRQIWNHYGPTEATICASVALVGRQATIDPPIGQAIAGALLYVLDDDGRAVADGVTGELFIGGPSLALGYHNLPQLTATQFLPDPFANAGRMYRTGDLVRRDDDGNLFFVGRKGRQVKFRGFRIELDEIETALRQLPGLHDAVLVALTANNTVVGLLAAMTAQGTWTLPAIRRALRDVLPVYMLPTKLVTLPKIPLNPSGKIDYAAIVSAPTNVCTTDEAPFSPMTPVEEVIVTVFRDVLQQPAIDVNSDFFDEGGDSLLAVVASERLEALLGRMVPVTTIYEGHTAATLARLINNDQRKSENLVVLQSGGVKEPIFCLPDIYGRPTSFMTLSRYFEGQRTIYGLAIGDMEDALVLHPSTETTTHAYLQAIKKQKPSGPYYVAGYSAGGIPAIDLACALEENGDDVVLILIDPFAQRFVLTIRNILRQLHAALRTGVSRGVQAGLNALVRHRLPDWTPALYAAATQALMEAEATWQSRCFRGRAIVAYCPQPRGLKSVCVAAWARFVAKAPGGWQFYLRGRSDTKIFASTHLEIMREPFVGTLVTWLMEAIAHQ